MKKFFENPTMNISVFDMEDIVTESANPTNLDLAEIEAKKRLDADGSAKMIKITF